MGTMEFTVSCASAEQMAEIFDSLNDEPASSGERTIIKSFFDWVNSADPADVAAMLVASTKDYPLCELCHFTRDVHNETLRATPATAAAIVGIAITRRLIKNEVNLASGWLSQAVEIIGADYPDGITLFLDSLPRGSLSMLLLDLTHFHQQLLDFFYELSWLENKQSHIPPLAKYLSPATIAELFICVTTGITPLAPHFLEMLFGKAGPCEEEDVSNARLKAMAAICMMDTLGGNGSTNAFLNRIYADAVRRPRIGELASTADIVLWIYQSKLKPGNCTTAELPELVKEIGLNEPRSTTILNQIREIATK